MSLIKLHKWFLGLAIIACVTSFSGYTESTELVCHENSEWVSLDKPVNNKTNYFFNTVVNQTVLIKELYLFEFNSLLKNYNVAVSLQFKSTNYEALQSVDDLYFEALINTSGTVDHHDIFIG